MTDEEKNPQAQTEETARTPGEVFDAGATGEKVKVRRLGRAPGMVGKRHTLFNAVDIIIILAIVALIAFAVIGIWFRDALFGGGAEMQTIEYTVLFTQVDEAFKNVIESGNNVYSVAEKQSVGTVNADVESNNSTYVAYLPATEAGGNGSAAALPYPGKVDLKVTIRVNASYREGVGYEVGGLRIAVGSEYTLRFPGYTGTGTCIDLNKVLS